MLAIGGLLIGAFAQIQLLADSQDIKQSITADSAHQTMLRFLLLSPHFYVGWGQFWISVDGQVLD
ncbi:hypothetical protein AX279_14790 [Pseudomonas sp. J237]|nr:MULTISPECIES: hypothetical protein [Pseudomonas]OEO24977.1 hypothetical protein AX279_14790 [Pseudomonas sp. J237]